MCLKHWRGARKIGRQGKMRNLADGFVIIDHKSLIGP